MWANLIRINVHTIDSSIYLAESAVHPFVFVSHVHTLELTLYSLCVRWCGLSAPPHDVDLLPFPTQRHRRERVRSKKLNFCSYSCVAHLQRSYNVSLGKQRGVKRQRMSANVIFSPYVSKRKTPTYSFPFFQPKNLYIAQFFLKDRWHWSKRFFFPWLPSKPNDKASTSVKRKREAFKSLFFRAPTYHHRAEI